MSIPASRTTTYAPGSPVRSDDLNDLQDAIVESWHGDVTRLVSAASGQVKDGGSPPPAGFAGSHWESDSTQQTAVYFPIPVEVGERIKAITVHLDEPDAAGEEVTVAIIEAGPGVLNSDSKDSGVTGAFATVEWTTADAFLPLTAQAGRHYLLEIIIPQTTTDGETRIFHAEVGVDRPRS